MDLNRKSYFKNARRIVVKVGSGVLAGTDGLNGAAIRSISKQICDLMSQGVEVILVSSGAMVSGMKKISLDKRPDDIPRQQAVAAIGQAGLILAYEKAFSQCGKNVAQILLTSDDFSNRKRYLNARNTFNTLLSWGVVPIVNENDTVAVEEIKVGDNDNLAAMMTVLMDADLLINLTDIDGLYTASPREDPDAKRLPVVASINKDIEAFASAIPGALGTGGMLSKVISARKVTAAGIPQVIANGLERGILAALFAGKDKGTFFVPKEKRLASRKCWIAFSLKPKGGLVVDRGAADAMVRKGKSLLPTGVVDVEGEFGVGAPVEFRRIEGDVVGKGLANYSAADIRKIMGLHSNQIKDRLGTKPYDEIIHRDNLVITGDGTD
ncbi:MAG: glutamate 5-kinase [Desulfobacterales bacterium]